MRRTGLNRPRAIEIPRCFTAITKGPSTTEFAICVTALAQQGHTGISFKATVNTAAGSQDTTFRCEGEGIAVILPHGSCIPREHAVNRDAAALCPGFVYNPAPSFSIAASDEEAVPANTGYDLVLVQVYPVFGSKRVSKQRGDMLPALDGSYDFADETHPIPEPEKPTKKAPAKKRSAAAAAEPADEEKPKAPAKKKPAASKKATKAKPQKSDQGSDQASGQEEEEEEETKPAKKPKKAPAAKPKDDEAKAKPPAKKPKTAAAAATTAEDSDGDAGLPTVSIPARPAPRQSEVEPVAVSPPAPTLLEAFTAKFGDLLKHALGTANTKSYLVFTNATVIPAPGHETPVQVLKAVIDARVGTFTKVPEKKVIDDVKDKLKVTDTELDTAVASLELQATWNRFGLSATENDDRCPVYTNEDGSMAVAISRSFLLPQRYLATGKIPRILAIAIKDASVNRIRLVILTNVTIGVYASLTQSKFGMKLNAPDAPQPANWNSLPDEEKDRWNKMLDKYRVTTPDHFSAFMHTVMDGTA
jgi:hypothetical protein